MKMRKLSVCLSVITLLSLTGCNAESFFNGTSAGTEALSEQVGIAMPASEVEEHGITADTPYKTIGDEEGVLFETALNEEDIAGNAEVGLYDDTHTKVSDLYDDGTHGDRIAGDGIYSCRYAPEVTEESEKEYTIKINDFETEPTSVRFFDEITEEDVKATQQLKAQFDAAISAYTSPSGSVAKEDRDAVITTLKAIAEQMQLSGEVVEYRINSNENIVLKMSSGITYIHQVWEDGYDSGHCPQDISVWSCQPCKAGYDSDLADYMKKPDAGANALDSEFDNVEFSENLDDGEVTLNTVRTFTTDQIVLWHGHGGYDPKLHSYILTGHQTSDGALSSEDLVEDRVTVCGDVYAFTYRFVDAYCGDLSNSLIYLGTCNSGRDGVLANSFLKKNCRLYIGNSQSIRTKYNTTMIRSVAEYLAEEKRFLIFGLGYRTASEALAKAKEDNGKDDGSGRNSKPLLFGDSAYILGEKMNEEESSVVGKTEIASGSISLDAAYLSMKAGETATVQITKYPKGYEAADFVWTIEDTSIATNNGGTVKALAKGYTVLKVESTDKKLSQFCAVSVS